MLDPTPEQVEAAAEAIRKVECRSALISDVDLPTYKARAALVAAAAGAASIDNSPRGRIIAEARRLGQRDWCHSVPEVAKAALNACAEALEDESAPVQVDEAKLAEVIAGTDSMVRIWCDENDLGRESLKIAKVVTEWLREEAEEYHRIRVK